MKDSKRTEMKVGITALAAVIALIWILGWAKNFSFSDDTKQLAIRFDNVAGLSTGDAVTINGVKKGYVENISLDDNKAIVNVILDNDAFLYSDASFGVFMLDLMGGKKVEINPGNSGEEINYSKIQNGKFSGDISTAMAALSSVQEDLTTVISEIKISVQQINESYLNKEFSNKVEKSIDNLNKLALNANKVLSENKDSLNSLISKGAELANTSVSIINENRENFKNTFEKLFVVLDNSNSLITKLDQFSKETMDRKNNAGKFLYDEKLFSDLQSTLSELKELTKILVEQIKGEGINVDANIF